MNYSHTPVMLKEVIAYLNPCPGQYFIDCTLGGGGYTQAISEKVGKDGKVLAIDLDILAINNAKNKTCSWLGPGIKTNNVILAHENFKNLSKIVKGFYAEKKIQNNKFNGIVFDLGLSSAQLEDRTRGFSFQQAGPLDMSFGQEGNKGSETGYIVNNWSEKELERILREYGEERFARLIARAIISKRKIKQIKTTDELVKIIEEVVPKKYHFNKIHPATRTFQALRIATNDELNNLESALRQALNLLKVGGKIIVISYHSLEDRIVKCFFKKESKDCLCPPQAIICQCGHKASLKILTKKIIIASEKEIKNNPRARSAKMRVAKKIKIKLVPDQDQETNQNYDTNKKRNHN
ncbi:MAG: 16S rRNA (cytosine(1402)-N(4))-methyltransferase RsmH [Patescibacteria group bacterium]